MERLWKLGRLTNNAIGKSMDSVSMEISKKKNVISNIIILCYKFICLNKGLRHSMKRPDLRKEVKIEKFAGKS